MRPVRRRGRLRSPSGPLGLLTQSAGDVDYARCGIGYAGRRRTDPSIAALIHEALGSAQTALNVGVSAGSYEPAERHVVAVEPSESMIAQRPSHLVPATRAMAGALPLGDGTVDASMAVITVHQWPDPTAGLAEMRRVTRGPVVILTFDPTEWASCGCRSTYPSSLPSRLAGTHRSPPSPLRWTRARRSTLCPFPLTAWTGSPKPSTAGRRRSSTRRCAGPSRHEASWNRR